MVNHDDPFASDEDAILKQIKGLRNELMPFLTGRSRGTAHDQLTRALDALMRRRLNALSDAARDDGQRWLGRDFYRTEGARHVGRRNFNSQLGIFADALTLGATDMQKQMMDRYDMRLGDLRIRWKELPLTDCIEHVMEYRSMPGTSRHHWGTEVDVVAADSSLWSTKPELRRLGEWLALHAPAYGFTVAFSADPSRGGYKHEPWHLSLTRISRFILKQYIEAMYQPTGDENARPEDPTATGMHALMAEVGTSLWTHPKLKPWRTKDKLAVSLSKDDTVRMGAFGRDQLIVALQRVNTRRYVLGVDPSLLPTADLAA